MLNSLQKPPEHAQKWSEVSSSHSSHFHFVAFGKILKMYYRHCKIGSMFFKKIDWKVNYIEYHSDLTGRMS